MTALSIIFKYHQSELFLIREDDKNQMIRLNTWLDPENKSSLYLS